LKPTSDKKKGRKQKAIWERGYNGHVYWLGKAKLGKVTLSGQKHYTWAAAGRGGEAESLDSAKKAVEMAILMADKQLDLFGE